MGPKKVGWFGVGLGVFFVFFGGEKLVWVLSWKSEPM